VCLELLHNVLGADAFGLSMGVAQSMSTHEWLVPSPDMLLQLLVHHLCQMDVPE
jgi:hypothetical protein